MTISQKPNDEIYKAKVILIRIKIFVRYSSVNLIMQCFIYAKRCFNWWSCRNSFLSIYIFKWSIINCSVEDHKIRIFLYFLSDTNIRSEKKSEKNVLSGDAIQWETWITEFWNFHINARIIDYDFIIFSPIMSYAIRLIESVNQETIKYTRLRFQWKWNDAQNLEEMIRWHKVRMDEWMKLTICAEGFFVNGFRWIFKKCIKNMQNRIAFEKYIIFRYW